MIALRPGASPSRHDDEVTHPMLDGPQYRKALPGRIGEKIGYLDAKTHAPISAQGSRWKKTKGSGSLHSL
jgi:hypothetical protein